MEATGAFLLKLIAISTLILLGWGVSCSESFAQQNLSKEERFKRTKAQFKTAGVSQPMRIPNVDFYPAGPGKFKYIRGIRYPSLGGGDNCIVQTVLFKDPPDVIREWYRNMLVQYGWNLQAANPSGTQILGRRRKEGASCHVMVSKSPQKEFKSLVQIRYVQFHPLDMDE